MKCWQRISSLQQIGTYLISRGIEPGGWLVNQGLPGTLLLQLDRWLELDKACELASRASRVTDNPVAGLHIAELCRLENLGGWADGIIHAATLGDALLYVRRNIHLISTGTRVEVECAGDATRLAMVYETPIEHGSRHHHLSNLLMCRKILNLAVEDVSAHVCLPWQQFGCTDEIERLLGAKLEFGAERAELVFDRDALQLRLSPMPEPLQSCQRSTAMATAVYEQMIELLHLQRPTLAKVADGMDTSPRTVQRWLKMWGVSFETILDEYRQNLALEQLAEERWTITDIAHQLGYSDSAHFTRACRRWTGSCPRQLREQGSAELQYAPAEAA